VGWSRDGNRMRVVGLYTNDAHKEVAIVLTQHKKYEEPHYLLAATGHLSGSIPGKSRHDFVYDKPPFSWGKFWTQTPEWFVWAVLDQDGVWSCHEEKPALTTYPWFAYEIWASSGAVMVIPELYSPPPTDYKTSLRSRDGAHEGSVH
jgi:hypothetical protein